MADSLSEPTDDHPDALHPDTLAVTSGRPPKTPDAPLNPPVVFASTYVGVREVGHGERGYGRYGNETWEALERTIGALEGGRALTFSSGMAAVDAVLEQIPQGGVVVVPTHCYLGVAALADERAERYGWTVRRADAGDTQAMVAAGQGADLVWLESPVNPTMEVADGPAIRAALPGVTMVMDNTFGTPVLQNPLAYGVDVVVHSATKFLSGHSDALLGAVVVRTDDEPRRSRLDTHRRMHGATPGTMEAFLVLRGIRTLPLRVRQAQASAGVLAERLAAHPAVRRVRYPGLADDAGHDAAVRTLRGFGSLLSIELADADAANRLIDALELWVFATSLGGVESMLERRRRWPGELPGVPEGLVRMSVGLEHVEDLWRDLERALGRPQ